MICLDGREIGYLGFVSNEQDELTDDFFIVIGEVGEWRGGYGRAAMGWLFRKAASLGLSRLTGQVLSNNERALKFYTAVGVVEVGRKERYFGQNGRTYATLRIEAEIPLERLRVT